MAKRRDKEGTKTKTRTQARDRTRTRTSPQGTDEENTLKTGTNPLAEIDDGLTVGPQRSSDDLIYESIMRGGGEPFGAPYEVGLSSLTERIVKFFNIKGFFGFETLEKTRKQRRRNRFTRYGSSRFFGRLDMRRARSAFRRKKRDDE